MARLATQDENAAVRIELTLDCSDLDRMVRFWEGAVGFVVVGVSGTRYVSLSRHGLTLTLQHVPEAKTVKNRMHLDLLVEDVEREVHRLEALGATRLTPVAKEEFGQTWFVLADPEGNEFCVALDPDTSRRESGE